MGADEPSRVAVLVVDDDKGIRQVLSEVLRLEGYTVQTAEQGGAPLEQLRAAQSRCWCC